MLLTQLRVYPVALFALVFFMRRSGADTRVCLSHHMKFDKNQRQTFLAIRTEQRNA